MPLPMRKESLATATAGGLKTNKKAPDAASKGLPGHGGHSTTKVPASSRVVNQRKSKPVPHSDKQRNKNEKSGEAPGTTSKGTVRAQGNEPIGNEQWRQYKDQERRFLEKEREMQAAENANQMGRGQRLGNDAVTAPLQVAIEERWQEAVTEHQQHRQYMQFSQSTIDVFRGSVLKDQKVWREHDQQPMDMDNSAGSFDDLQNLATVWRRRYMAKRRSLLAIRTKWARERASRQLAMMRPHYGRWRHELMHTAKELEREKADDYLDEIFDMDFDVKYVDTSEKEEAVFDSDMELSSRVALAHTFIDEDVEELDMMPSEALSSLRFAPVQLPALDIDSLVDYDYGPKEEAPMDRSLFGTCKRHPEGVLSSQAGRVSRACAVPKFKSVQVRLSAQSEDDAFSSLVVLSSLRTLPSLPPLHMMQPSQLTQQFLSPMPYTELSPEYHLANPLNPFVPTTHKTRIEGLQSFQGRDVSGLTSTSRIALSAVWPVAGKTQCLPRGAQREPKEQNCITAEDEESASYASQPTAYGPPDIRVVKLQQEHPTAITALPHAETVLSGRVHRLPVSSVVGDVEQFLVKKAAEGRNRLGVSLEKRVMAYVDKMGPGKLKKSSKKR